MVFDTSTQVRQVGTSFTHWFYELSEVAFALTRFPAPGRVLPVHSLLYLSKNAVEEEVQDCNLCMNAGQPHADIVTNLCATFSALRKIRPQIMKCTEFTRKETKDVLVNSLNVLHAINSS